MSKYTTGEVARLCDVSVRTVQYYDSRGILIPSELSEGGRRLYSEEDVRKMRIICFLRQAGLSIGSIGQLMEEKDPGSVIEILLSQQEEQLREEVAEREQQLEMLSGIRREMKSIGTFSVESIGDIAYMMTNRKKLSKLHAFLLGVGLAMEATEIVWLILSIKTGNWWIFAAGMLVVNVPLGIWMSAAYLKRTAYICPQCHEVFVPKSKESFWAYHTPRTRRLTCPHCGHKGMCVETYREAEKK